MGDFLLSELKKIFFWCFLQTKIVMMANYCFFSLLISEVFPAVLVGAVAKVKWDNYFSSDV